MTAAWVHACITRPRKIAPSANSCPRNMNVS